MESIRLTPFFLALLLAGSLVIAANAQSTSTSTASPSVTGADSMEIVGDSVPEDQEERNLRIPPGAPLDWSTSSGDYQFGQYGSPVEPIDNEEELNRNLRIPPAHQPYPVPPPSNQPICCIDCRQNDYNCLSTCVGDCRPESQCVGAGQGAYRAFCEDKCPRTGAMMMGASRLVPTPACRGMCKKEVQELCLARACSDIVPGCYMSNCSSEAPARCG